MLATAIRVVDPDAVEAIEELISTIQDDIGNDEPNQSRYQEMLQRIASSLSQRSDSGYLPHERVLRLLAGTARLTILDGDAAKDGVKALLNGHGVSWNDDSSAGGTSANGDSQPTTLAAHQKAVGVRAKQFACNLGLPEPIVRAVRLASQHHDEGKRDPRFQVMLHRGDPWRARAAAEPLAKSGMDSADRAAFRLAQRLSRYPSAMRHEALSARIAALLLAHDEEALQVDSDLVLHLVASHHGYGRPLLPPVVDGVPVQVEVPLNGAKSPRVSSDETVDWDGPERFADLCRSYGRWGLALLETIVRLADIWCSARAEESR
jgi:CRISPR-associated endonuclease/helicase Cas3